MGDFTAGTRYTHTQRGYGYFDDLWRLAHRGAYPKTCAYCGHRRNDHAVSRRIARAEIPEGWRLPRKRTQYTMLFSLGQAKAMGAGQVVCFALPVAEDGLWR